MSFMRSMQGRLIVALTSAAAVLSLAMGVALYHSIRGDLIRGFDRTLDSQASAVSSFINVKPDGTLDFDYNDATMREYRASPHAQYFIVRYADGRVFAKSASLKDVAAPPRVDRLGEGKDVILPTGREGRALRLDFTPVFDPDANPGAKPPTMTVGPEMNIVVARDRASLDAALNHFLRRMILGGAMIALATAIAVIFIVRRSLRPLRNVADSARAIEPGQLDRRLPVNDLPAELLPIVTCLNELLGRLDQAFTRERRFTSDVAHELRTPIAELRAITEVALKWPSDTSGVLSAVRDSNEIAAQLQTLVATLLSLVRTERAASTPLATVLVGPIVERVLNELSSAAANRTISIDLDDDVAVTANATLMTSVLRNLISNALEYGDRLSPVRISAVRENGRWLVTVENAASKLREDDVTHLFDPFWRKDAARTDSVHTGLGLALVQAYCRLMDATISARLLPPGVLRMEMSFEAGNTTPAQRDVALSFDRGELVASGGGEDTLRLH